ncbi:hypothetical protein NDU88_006298 [Pleurodeles waltl]|uniref:Uncharacterized protein n=1 Tax=Pleurodeles waltl TaxID=8319 RepID=A0AAV7VPA9_PLEWA|nr:hypothetical protein NDU88_006298 [Pleurodeles waltl]
MTIHDNAIPNTCQVGDSTCTKPTGADTAPGAREQPGAGTNKTLSSAVTSWARDGNAEGGGEKTPLSEGGEESGGEEEEESSKEEEESGSTEERFLPSRVEEDEEVTDGGLNTAVDPGGKAKNPATLLEKRGTSSEEEEESVGIGERFLPSRGEEYREAADGGLNTAVAPGGKAKNPATLQQVRVHAALGITRGTGGREERE